MPGKKITSRTRAALMAEWTKLSPNIEAEPREGEKPKAAERRVRIEWANEKLGSRKSEIGNRKEKSGPDFPLPTSHSRLPIESFNDLGENEARYLIRCAREESGDGPAYRAKLIAIAAAELWGKDWNEFLGNRIAERFTVGAIHESPLQALSPAQAHSLLEELVSRIARNHPAVIMEGVSVEEMTERVRARIRARAHHREHGDHRDSVPSVNSVVKPLEAQ